MFVVVGCGDDDCDNGGTCYAGAQDPYCDCMAGIIGPRCSDGKAIDIAAQFPGLPNSNMVVVSQADDVFTYSWRRHYFSLGL